jgi:hypothetical protein
MPFDGTKLGDVARTLIRAREILDIQGWCPNGATDDEGRVCVVAAINSVRSYSIISATAITFIRKAIDSNDKDLGIGRWNDTPGRTIEEVHAVFDRAIGLAIADKK